MNTLMITPIILRMSITWVTAPSTRRITIHTPIIKGSIHSTNLPNVSASSTYYKTGNASKFHSAVISSVRRLH